VLFYAAASKQGRPRLRRDSRSFGLRLLAIFFWYCVEAEVTLECISRRVPTGRIRDKSQLLSISILISLFGSELSRALKHQKCLPRRTQQIPRKQRQLHHHLLPNLDPLKSSPYLDLLCSIFPMLNLTISRKPAKASSPLFHLLPNLDIS